MGEWASASYPAMVSHLLLKLTFLLKTDQNFSTTEKLNFTQQVFATICAKYFKIFTICTNYFIMFHNMHKIFHTHHCPDEKNLSEKLLDGHIILLHAGTKLPLHILVGGCQLHDLLVLH